MTAPVSPQMHQKIRETLAEIIAEEDIKILFAIESGSRAWGFHSPDSDYDVRFVYVRPVEWHLQLGKKRDVLERPIDAELDISGWDLGKALGLALQSNSVISEWLQSPITYIEDAAARADLTGFCQQTLTRRPVTWHYSAMLKQQLDRATQDGGEFHLKRFFYAVRPALALRWMQIHDRATPPMDMANLMAQSDLPQAIETDLLDLIERKKTLTEGSKVQGVPDGLINLVHDALSQAEIWLQSSEKPSPRQGALEAANALHIAQVLRMRD